MINDLKELQALLKLCRKQGVTEINLGGVAIKFGELPIKRTTDADEPEEEPEELSDEMVYFSVRPPEGN